MDRIILNDDTGIVALYKGRIENKEEIFESLKTSHWKQETIKMLGKEFLARRFLCTYGNPGITYTFARKTEGCYSWETNTGIQSLHKQVNKLMNTEYNYVITNYYPDHNSQLGYHSDNEKDLVSGFYICSVSLGATREFRIQPITKKFEAINRQRPELIKINLEDGDVLVMGGNLQKFWKHAVLESKTPCGPRINTTFRVLKTL